MGTRNGSAGIPRYRGGLRITAAARAAVWVVVAVVVPLLAEVARDDRPDPQGQQQDHDGEEDLEDTPKGVERRPQRLRLAALRARLVILREDHPVRHRIAVF